MTTKEAFSALISRRNWQSKAKIHKSTAASIERRFKEGGLSLDKIEKILSASGFKVVQEKTWMEE